MIKKTLLIEGNNYLSIKNEQLIITSKETGEINSKCPNDIGIIIFDNKEITYTHSVISKLLYYNIAIIFCNDKHMPIGMFLNFDSNYSQTLTINKQITLTQSKKDKIWKELITQKILNQSNLINKCNKLKSDIIKNLASKVKLGDKTNREGVSAKIYWKSLFGSNFTRDKDGETPNDFLNFGYAILRSLTAKSLSGSGLLPIIGIHHHNQYNAFCLADDIMEPYRPYVDLLVYEYINNDKYNQTFKEFKKFILTLPTEDVIINDMQRPLSIALTFTTSSLSKFIMDEVKHLSLPNLHYEPRSF